MNRLYTQIWLKIGTDGFAWVRWGKWARAHSKTRHKEAKMSKWDIFSAPMAGEISPDITFGGVWRKVV